MAVDGGCGKFGAIGVIVGAISFYGGLLMCRYCVETWSEYVVWTNSSSRCVFTWYWWWWCDRWFYVVWGNCCIWIDIGMADHKVTNC